VKHSGFVHLHVHTEYSILGSTCRIRDLVRRAEKFRMPALAMTDSANFFGAVPFYEACRSHGIKPILGAEVYLAPKDLSDKTPTGVRDESYPLVLLVRDEKGYRNACQLLTTGHFEGFYYRPRIDKGLLSRHADGLIALSAGMDGEIASLVLQGRMEQARESIRFFQSIFGREHFYLELLDHGLKQEKHLNQKLVELSWETEAPLVAANNCHYLEREDSFAFEIARCIATQTTLNESRSTLEGMEYHFKSPADMSKLFSEVPEAVSRSLEIAERCNFEMDLESRYMPEYAPPSGKNREQFLLELCRSGMEGKVDPDSDAVRERLEHEMRIIRQMGFISYFLIVWDFVHYARKQGIPVGPGRGSAAGSLIAYLLGITSVNPLRHGLLFERFLNPDRVSMPDIDIDFCYDRRGAVIDYVSGVYGNRSVAQIITFGTLAARAVIRDVGRVMGIPFPKVDQIAKMIPAEPKMTLNKALDLERNLADMIREDQEVDALFTNAMKLEGLPRNTSTHAAGIIISKGELTDRVPLYRGQNAEVVTQFDGPSCERVGLLKMDFLGLKTLTVMDNTLKMIRQRIPDFPVRDPNALSLDDARTFALLNKGNTLGVFQLESGGMRDLMKRLGVREFADIVALVALYRPGPMQMADEFIQRKHGRVKVEYLHPSLEEILKETYGIMLYQEQVMQCVQVMAGFSLAEADILRRIMGKKKEEAMKQLRDKFIDGCRQKGIDRRIAAKTFEQMEYFAGYGFNKSHSVAYGLIAYQTAWFKANHPREFMSALLSSEKNNTDKISFYIEECRAMEIRMRPPSVQHSAGDFTVEEDGIRYGLEAVKNVGSGAVETIVATRKEGGPFRSLEDFVKRVDARALNKKTLESLVRAGAFDELESNRRYVFEIVDDMIRYGGGTHRDQALGQESFLDVLDSTSRHSLSPKKKEDYPNWSEHDQLKSEKELLGCYISGHPLAEYSRVLKRFSTTSTKDIRKLPDGAPVKIGGVISYLKLTRTIKTGESMAILQIEDLLGTVEAVVYPRVFRVHESLLKPDAPVFIQGIVQIRNEAAGVIVNEMSDLARVQENLTTALYIRIHETEQAEVLHRLKDVVERFPGSCRLFLDLTLASGKTVVVRASSRFAVTPCEEAVQEIERLIGENSLWLHIKDQSRKVFDSRRKR
jgi:DNA polymerase-3 subunit alpha